VVEFNLSSNGVIVEATECSPPPPPNLPQPQPHVHTPSYHHAAAQSHADSEMFS
jgi:hypothetical protein